MLSTIETDSYPVVKRTPSEEAGYTGKTERRKGYVTIIDDEKVCHEIKESDLQSW